LPFLLRALPGAHAVPGSHLVGLRGVSALSLAFLIRRLLRFGLRRVSAWRFAFLVGRYLRGLAVAQVGRNFRIISVAPIPRLFPLAIPWFAVRAVVLAGGPRL